MDVRRLGDGTPVGEIALGAMAFSNFYAGGDDAAGVAAIQRALDADITLIDTAEVYGMGHSEKMVGTAVRDRRDEAVIATKSINGHPDYLREAIDRSLTPQPTPTPNGRVHRTSTFDSLRYSDGDDPPRPYLPRRRVSPGAAGL